MSIDRLVDDVDPAQRTETQTIEIRLTVAESRRLVEHIMDGPAFRIWVSAAEYAALNVSGIYQDWTFHQLKDGRYAMWRSQKQLDQTRTSGDTGLQVASEIEARIIADDVE